MHGYHWNCAEDQYNRWKAGVSKKEIDTKYGHKVVVETKVKCYANYTKYGLGKIKEQMGSEGVNLSDSSDDDKGEEFSGDCRDVESGAA